MKTTTDWQEFKTTIHLAGVDYQIRANVFIEEQPVGQSLEHFGAPCRESSTEVTATLEGWTSLPECPKNREPELEQRLIEEIDQREW